MTGVQRDPQSRRARPRARPSSPSTACGCAAPRCACLRRRLEANGFDVHVFSYPSVSADLAANAASLAAFIDAVPGETVHVVGHSLGGVLVRAMLETRRRARLGRVVCLGSPFTGSRTAARVARLPGGARLIGRSLARSARARRASTRGARRTRSGSSRAACRSASAGCSAVSASRTTARSRLRRRANRTRAITSCCRSRTWRCSGRPRSRARFSISCDTGSSRAPDGDQRARAFRPPSSSKTRHARGAPFSPVSPAPRLSLVSADPPCSAHELVYS